MNFSTNIDLGNILTVIALLGSLWTFHKANVKRITIIELRVGMMWKQFAKRFDLPEDLDEVNHHL